MTRMAAVSHEDDDYGIGSRKRPCRTCTDFKSWSQLQKASINSKENEKKTTASILHEKDNENRQQQCPVDKDELGRSTWTFLHTMAAYYPSKPSETVRQDMSQFISLFSKFYPCNVCAEDLKQELKVSPPDTSSQSGLSRWMCDLHNTVNAKLGKPLFDCKRVNERWRDGPSDGSCD